MGGSSIDSMLSVAFSTFLETYRISLMTIEGFGHRIDTEYAKRHDSCVFCGLSEYFLALKRMHYPRAMRDKLALLSKEKERQDAI